MPCCHLLAFCLPTPWQAHFVEMDPWVVRSVLGPNITACGFNNQAVVHVTKAEAFLQKWVDGHVCRTCTSPLLHTLRKGPTTWAPHCCSRHHLRIPRAKSIPRFAGGAFDFISVCPPYLMVSYPELFGLLDGSPLLHDRSIVFVEYPKQLAHEIPDHLGPLAKVRVRACAPALHVPVAYARAHMCAARAAEACRTIVAAGSRSTATRPRLRP